MSTMQNKMMGKIHGQAAHQWLLMLILTLQVFTVYASDVVINNLEFSSLAGNQLQIQLGLSGAFPEPKLFQTDNPARIALDFEGVTSSLAKKSFPINQGPVNTVYVVEASGRTRVVVNLAEKVPYETKIVGNKYYVVLKSPSTVAAVNKIVRKSVGKESSLSRFLPEQGIQSIDFRRGPNGEGRLLLGLSTPNTVVDAKQTAGKVVLSFLNTKVPKSLVKSYDVLDFATPVQKIDVKQRGQNTTITITPSSPNFDYSSYQADNVLTVEFRPLTPAEKEAQLREKQPYIGSKLSLNFQDIDVKSVLMILADHIKTQEGKEINIITTDSVTGSIALHVNDVPWDQVLDVVMKLRGLSKRENGNVILIGPTEEIKLLEEKELEARKIYEQLEPLKTENIQINYARALDICNILIGRGNLNQGGGPISQGSGTGGTAGGAGRTRGGCGSVTGSRTGGLGQQLPGLGAPGTSNIGNLRLISPRGAVIVDARTNTLIVKDTAKKLEEIHEMIAKLDIPVRQVLIEARIVIATTSFAQNIGTKFGVAKKAAIGGGKEFGFTGSGVSTSENSQILQDLGTALATSSGGSLAMTLARGADYLLNLEISALQNNGLGELVSNPRVMTQDRVPASIRQGLEIPYLSSSANLGTNTTFKDAVLEMQVIPQITPTGSVIMSLNIKRDSKGAENVVTAGGGAPPIDRREVETMVQVEDGETVVLGGVYEADTNKTVFTVPWVSDLPLIGWMFKRTEKDQAKRELLIFITPKVIKDSSISN